MDSEWGVGSSSNSIDSESINFKKSIYLI